MTLALLSALLLCVPASARDAGSGASGFAVAEGAAAFSVITDAAASTGRIVARRLALDGGVAWEDRFGSGREEEAVAAAVTRYGGLTVIGNREGGGCWLVHWSSRGRLDWDATPSYGASCQARTVLVDSHGNTYVLGTTTVGDQFDATLWKYDHLGNAQWIYRPTGGASHYAFSLALAPGEDAVTVTHAISGPNGWVYESYDVDSAGRRR